MLLLDCQLQELCRTCNVNELVVVEVFALDGEKNIAIVSRHHQHDGRGLTGAESIFVHDDLDATVAVAKISGGIGCDEDVGLRIYGWQKFVPPTAVLAALPLHSVVAVSLRPEAQFRFTLGIRFHCRRRNVVVLITAKLKSPGPLAPCCRLDRRWKYSRLLAQQTKLFPFHFPTIRIKPDFIPVIAGDLY